MTGRRLRVETERLIVSPAGPERARSVADFWRSNRAHFARWDPRRPDEFFTDEFWAARLTSDQERAADGAGYRFFLCPKDSPDQTIGYANFANVVRGAFHCCHLGFGLDEAHVGRGLMSEGLEGALSCVFGVVGLHRVEANHRPENLRSAAVLRRLGFAPQGYARDYLRIDGAWRDHVLTARLNPSWTPPG